MRILLAALLCSLALAAADDPLADLRKAWGKLDRAARVDGLLRLQSLRTAAVVSQCRSWLKGEEDPLVRAQLVRLLVACGRESELEARAHKVVAGYLDAHLDWRQRQEDREFKLVCKKHGTKIPPGTASGRGAAYEDPYDEERRELPVEIRAERAHMFEVIASIEGIDAMRAPLLRAFQEHHDPEVLVRLVQAFAKRREWRALPAMADLWRIQEQGRAVGGGVVIGEKKFRTLRLKWDLHRDRLWWSRPEYVLRITTPAREACNLITGAQADIASEFDGWLLDHQEVLERHGVKLTREFRARAEESRK